MRGCLHRTGAASRGVVSIVLDWPGFSFLHTFWENKKYVRNKEVF